MSKRWVFLSLAALYSLGLGIYFSSRHLMVLDELFAWNIIDDPSFRHAMSSWNHGADGGGVLFYASLWPIAHWSKGSVLGTRLISAICYFLAGVVWWRVLSRFMDSRWAAAGVALLWLASDALLFYIDLIRFYELFILLCGLAVWTVLYAADEDSPPALAALLIFVAHGCLLLTHMLGVMYSALVLGAALLCLFPGRRALLVALSGLSSWLTLIPCRTAIHLSSINAASQVRPVFRDVLRYYFKAAIAMPVTILAILGLVWLLLDLWERYRTTRNRSDPTFLAPVLCLAYLLGPIGVYLISVFVRPVGAARYLLPYFLSLAALCGYALQRLAPRPGETGSKRLPRLQLASLLVLVLALHLLALKKIPPSPSLQTEGLAQLASGRPVLVMDEASFFQLQYYKSNKNLQFHAVIAPSWDPTPSLMTTVAQRGYYPGSITRVDAFEHRFPEFLVLTRPGYVPAYWFPNPSTCQSRQLGVLLIDELPETVYEYTHCRSDPPQAL